MNPTPPVTNPRCQPLAPHDLLRARANFLQKIRDFFNAHDFLEVETPALIPCADPSPHLSSFTTSYTNPITQASMPLFLRTSPEFAMKQLVAHGYPRIFQLCKFFRNGEISPMHNPEFTGLEWYATEQDYRYLMTMTELLCQALWPSQQLTYQGETLDLRLPWERLTVHEAIARYAGVTLPPVISRDHLIQACTQTGVTATADDAWDDLFFKLFLTHVEPRLGVGRPTFLLDYPIQLAALSRPKPGAPHLAERVELYIGGLEIANGYSELTDPIEQRQRFEEEAAYRKQQGDPTPYPPDPGLLNALAWGMPPTAGIAIGVDRLLMLDQDAATIQEVLPFPLSLPETT